MVLIFMRDLVTEVVSGDSFQQVLTGENGNEVTIDILELIVFYYQMKDLVRGGGIHLVIDASYVSELKREVDATIIKTICNV